MPAPPVEPGSGDAASATNLVVEPDILVRMVIADYLRDCGYKVVEGVNADDALAVLGAGKKIDVILTEVQLASRMDGFGLARQIRENHPVIEAANAAEANEVFTSGEAVDVVFTDVQMPSAMDGLMLARWVRRHEVLVTSGKGDDAVSSGLVADDAFFSKPYRLEAVAARIHSAVPGR